MQTSDVPEGEEVGSAPETAALVAEALTAFQSAQREADRNLWATFTGTRFSLVTCLKAAEVLRVSAILSPRDTSVSPGIPPNNVKDGELRRHISELAVQATLNGEKPQGVAAHWRQLQHESDLRDIKTQGIIYEGRRLPENQERQVKPLVEALVGQDHALRRGAEQTVRKFTDTVEKSKLRDVTSLSQASRDYHIPLSVLSEWVAKELIPIVYRDRKTIYVARETLEKVAQVHQQGKERGVRTARLLKEMRDALGFSSSTNLEPED
jgi:hypothetical protein